MAIKKLDFPKATLERATPEKVLTKKIDYPKVSMERAIPPKIDKI